VATQAYPTAADQRDDLRARVGQATNVLILSDDECNRCLAAGLRQLNLHAPAWSFGSFLTIAAQQRYAIATVAPSTKIGKMRVFWQPGGGGGTCATPGIFSSLGDLTDFVLVNVLGTSGVIPYIDEASLELNARFNATIERYLGGAGWEAEDGYVYLDPRPSASGDSVYFYAPVQRFATALAVDYEWSEALMSYAEYIAFGLLAGKQSEVAGATCSNGKGVRTMGGTTYLTMRKESHDKFLALVSDGYASVLPL